MDIDLLKNVKNSIIKFDSSAVLNLEVIHLITWKNLRKDPSKNEVLYFYLKNYLKLNYYLFIKTYPSSPFG